MILTASDAADQVIGKVQAEGLVLVLFNLRLKLLAVGCYQSKDERLICAQLFIVDYIDYVLPVYAD